MSKKCNEFLSNAYIINEVDYEYDSYDTSVSMTYVFNGSDSDSIEKVVELKENDMMIIGFVIFKIGSTDTIFNFCQYKNLLEVRFTDSVYSQFFKTFVMQHIEKSKINIKKAFEREKGLLIDKFIQDMEKETGLLKAYLVNLPNIISKNEESITSLKCLRSSLEKDCGND